MSPLPFLLALAAQGGANPVPLSKPIVIATTAEHTGYESYALNDPYPEHRRDALRSLVEKSHYVARETEHFTLLTPPDCLGIAQARAQIPLLQDLAKRTGDGSRVVQAKDLPPDEQQVLRSMVAAQAHAGDERAASSPELQFFVAPLIRFDLESGGTRAPLWVLPGFSHNQAHYEASKGTYVTLAPASQADSKKPPEVVPAPSRKGRLTFLVPSDVQGDKELEWIGEAQAILLKEAKAAKADWSRAHDAFLHVLDKETKETFAHFGGSRFPRVDELSPDAGHYAAQMFGQQHLASGGAPPEAWLSRAQTVGFSVEPVLSLGITTGNPRDGISNWNIQFNCPIGP